VIKKFKSTVKVCREDCSLYYCNRGGSRAEGEDFRSAAVKFITNILRVTFLCANDIEVAHPLSSTIQSAAGRWSAETTDNVGTFQKEGQTR